MAIRLGDLAPDFTAESTEGTISFHEWLGDGWGILFSHPKDFTPVCTTELGQVARLKATFERRNVKVIGLSVDSTSDHKTWAKDILEWEEQGGDSSWSPRPPNSVMKRIRALDFKPYVDISDDQFVVSFVSLDDRSGVERNWWTFSAGTPHKVMRHRSKVLVKGWNHYMQ